MRSVAKHSYIKGASGRARAKAHVNYIQYRHGPDRDEKPREFFSPDREGIQGREVKQDIDNSERAKVVAHKLILSPGLQNVDMQKYTRDVLKDVGREKGLDLDWRAVIHKNTDHDHAHVIVFGKDKNGREVLFDKEDYKNMRDAGDRYLERHHFLERYLPRDMDRQMDKGFERDRGDNIFEVLVRDLNRDKEHEAPERKPYEAKPWDKEKAIEYLPESEKFERNGETYSKYSKLEDLKEIAEKLNAHEIERLPDEQYQKLGQWIWTKENHADDHYERKAQWKWDKKEKKKEKERDPFEDDREFKKLDKDLKRAFKEMEKGGDFGKGYKQWMREQQGRLSPEHRSYTDAMAEQRLRDLMERFPDRKEDFERQLEELKQLDQELKPVEPKGDKWRDFDALLGENWKSPEKELEQGKDQDAAKPATGSGNLIADRAGQDLAIDQVHAEASGDQTKIEQEKEIDDGFDRGLG